MSVMISTLPGKESLQCLRYLHSFMMIAIVLEDSSLSVSRAYVQGVGNAAKFIHLRLDCCLGDTSMIELA